MSIFGMLSCVIGVLFREMYLVLPVFLNSFPRFSSNSCIALDLMNRFLIHSEFIFQKDEKHRYTFIILHVEIFTQQHLLKKLSFLGHVFN